MKIRIAIVSALALLLTTTLYAQTGTQTGAQAGASASAAVSASSAAAPAASVVEPIAKSLTQQLAERHFDAVAAHFDKTMTEKLPSATLASTWDGLLTQVGAYKSMDATNSKVVEGYREVLITAMFEKTPLNLRWVFDSKNNVAGFFIEPVDAPAQATAGLEALAQNLTHHMAARQFDIVVSHFDKSMTAALPAAKLAETWDSLLAKTGAFQSIEGMHASVVSAYRIVLVGAKFEKGSLTLRWIFDKDGHVSGFSVDAPQKAAPDASKK
jgi:hypothetical protein